MSVELVVCCTVGGDVAVTIRPVSSPPAVTEPGTTRHAAEAATEAVVFAVAMPGTVPVRRIALAANTPTARAAPGVIPTTSNAFLLSRPDIAGPPWVTVRGHASAYLDTRKGRKV